MSVPVKPYPAESAQATRYSALGQQMAAQIQRGMKKHKVTGLSVALVDAGEVVWAQGFGYADKAAGRLADVDTVYKAGSITKLVTGSAIMQLVEAGQLELDAPIQTYLPELQIRYHAPTDRPITLRHIMSHSSGLPVDALHGMFSRNPESFHRSIDYLNATHAAYPPGTIATYSNLATDLLGVVIERVSGQSYPAYIRDRVLAPLGMSQSTVDDAAVNRQQLSLGYRKGKHQEEYPLRDLPAGNLYTTVLDLARFVEMALEQGQPILSPPAFAEMTREQTGKLEYDTGARFGLNWVLRQAELDYLGAVLCHNGGTLHFMSTLVVLPEQGLGVVVLANSAGSMALVQETANATLKAAARLKHGIEPPPPPPAPAEVIALPPEVAGQSAGYFASQLGGLRIEQRGRKLLAQLGGRTLHLRYHADGWLSPQYRLLGLIPIKIPALEQERFRVVEQNGQRILQVKEHGHSYLGGIAVEPPPPIHPAWRQALGKYRPEYLAGDFEAIKHLALIERHGQLMLRLNLGKLGGGIVAPLRTLSDEMALIEGLGRAMQETVYLREQEGTPELYFSGYRMIKAR